MGTPIEDLRPGDAVVVNAVVDRIMSEGIHGINAVVVRMTNAQATARHDAVARVVVSADDVTEAARLWHFSAEHARLAEWLLDERPADVAERMSDTGAVDLCLELLARLAVCEGLLVKLTAGKLVADDVDYELTDEQAATLIKLGIIAP